MKHSALRHYARSRMTKEESKKGIAPFQSFFWLAQKERKAKKVKSAFQAAIKSRADRVEAV